MDSQIEFAYLTTNGIRLHTALAGPQDRPLVVLLHGFPEFWYSWHYQIEPLSAAGYRLLVPDQRGYNLSDVPKEVNAYRLDNLCKDIVGLLDALGQKECYLVGHDWGAMVAWSIALKYPDRVKKLAILNVPHPAVMVEFLRKNPRQMLKSWYIAFFQIPGLVDWLLRRNDFKLAAALLTRSSRPGTFSNEDITEYKNAWEISAGLTGMINWYRALARYPKILTSDLRLHMPVRILWGKLDPSLTHEMAARSMQFCDQADLTMFERATHWVQHEEATAVNRELIEFFGG
jgi:pimeloyl-ACP methyl ester carboxylesterase